jgi:hypothetical protein
MAMVYLNGELELLASMKEGIGCCFLKSMPRARRSEEASCSPTYLATSLHGGIPSDLERRRKACEHDFLCYAHGVARWWRSAL